MTIVLKKQHWIPGKWKWAAWKPTDKKTSFGINKLFNGGSYSEENQATINTCENRTRGKVNAQWALQQSTFMSALVFRRWPKN